MKEKGTLYLIPSPLGGDDPADVIPGSVLERIRSIRRYVVEEVRTVSPAMKLGTDRRGVPEGTEGTDAAIRESRSLKPISNRTPC